MHGISSLSFLLLLTFVFAAQRKETAALTKSYSQKKGLASTVVTDTEYKKTQRIMFLERDSEIRELKEKFTKLQARNGEFESQLQAHKDTNSDQKREYQSEHTSQVREFQNKVDGMSSSFKRKDEDSNS